MNQNNLYKYLIFIAGLIIFSLAVWYFKDIITYILISAVLSLIGAPVVDLLGRFKIKHFHLPKGLRAGITLLLLWLVFLTFFRIFVPLVALEAQKISVVDTDKLLATLNEPVNKLDAIINELALTQEKFSIISFLKHKIESVLNIGLFTNLFGAMATTIGTIFIACFSISFITFFFLKDESLFGKGILLLVPTKYEEAAKQVLHSTKKLLVRYFIGIGMQVTGIIILTALGLYIVGISFQTCLVIAFFAGIINVIPYVGPLIGSIFAVLMGITSKLQAITPEQLLPLIIAIIIVFTVVHLIDNIVFQPFIFSNSVKAHPLEIFIVLLVAGHLAGIMGMLIAIPGYTVIRVFAKQFLNNFKVVKKLTEKI